MAFVILCRLFILASVFALLAVVGWWSEQAAVLAGALVLAVGLGGATE